MKRALQLTLAAAIVLATMTQGQREAQARAQRISYYDYAQVWRAAVRFLRIDEGHKIVERDPKAGYVIFELVRDGKKFTGFLELIQLQDRDRRLSVRMVMNIKNRPQYLEDGLLYRLELKLRKELGPHRHHYAPPPAAPTPPPATTKVTKTTRKK